MFGEERFIEMALRKRVAVRSDKNSGHDKNEDQDLPAPFTIKCLSTQAEVLKISNLDF